MQEIKWEEPPQEAILRSRAGSGAKHLDFAMALRKHPNRWAVLPQEFEKAQQAQSNAQNIRRGVTKAFAPKGSFESVCDGPKIYVRFVGEPQESEPAAPGGDDEDAKADKGLAVKIREWAREHDIEVAAHGRLPRSIIDRYFSTHPHEEIPPHLRAVN